MSWNSVSLGEHVEKIGSGITPRGGSSVYVQVGTALIRSQNVYNNAFTTDGLAYISEQHAERMRNVAVQKEDILLNITGDSVARCCIVPERVLPARVNQHVAIIRPVRDTLNPKFLAYFLTSPHMQATMLSLAGSGGTRKALTKGMIEKFGVPCPPIEVQDRIVDLLAGYDNLIENNRRRIELLERAALELYKEWFARLRFPGHEHVDIVNGVPSSWKSATIGDFCTVGRGASPRPIKDYLDGEIPWFKIGDATASESPFIFETAEKVIERGASRSIKLSAGELILSNSATCGVPNFTGVPGCIHDGWLYFKGLHGIDKFFLYLYLVHSQRAILQGIGEGATQKNLNTTYISQQELSVPQDGKLLEVFSSIVGPMFQQVFTLARQNMHLARARDLLLPKLMSGEIAV